jgi:hypothetical protein
MQQHAHLVSVALARHSAESAREISSMFSKVLVDRAQRRAERVSLRQRRDVLRTDNWLDEYLGFAAKELG